MKLRRWYDGYVYPLSDRVAEGFRKLATKLESIFLVLGGSRAGTATMGRVDRIEVENFKSYAGKQVRRSQWTWP